MMYGSESAMAHILLSILALQFSCYTAGDQGHGAPPLQRQTETVGVVQPREENAPERS